MSTELAIYAPGTLDAKVEYCKLLSDSGLLPDAYRGKPANVLYALEYGEVLGIPAMAAITGIHIIKGKPSASAGLVGALVRKAGHKLRVRGDDTSARAVIVRADDPDFEFVSEWTLDRAVIAKLCTIKDGKPYARDKNGEPTSWEKYPAAMLKHRAVTEVSRDACEEVLFGMHYTPEELGAEVDADGIPVVVQVRQVPESAPPAPPREPQPAQRRPAAGLERDKPQQPTQDEWTQPAPTNVANSNVGQQIEDAEIVPEPRQSVQGQHIAISQLFELKHGVTTRDRKLAGVAHYLHHPVTSTKELTYDDAAELIATLSALPDRPKPQQEARPVNVSDSSAAAVAEAQKLATYDESDADRIEQAHRDAIESAGSAEDVDLVLERVGEDVRKDVLHTARRDALIRAAAQRKDQLRSDQGWAESQRVAPQGAPVAVGAAA